MYLNDIRFPKRVPTAAIWAMADDFDFVVGRVLDPFRLEAASSTAQGTQGAQVARLDDGVRTLGGRWVDRNHGTNHGKTPWENGPKIVDLRWFKMI